VGCVCGGLWGGVSGGGGGGGVGFLGVYFCGCVGGVVVFVGVVFFVCGGFWGFRLVFCCWGVW